MSNSDHGGLTPMQRAAAALHQERFGEESPDEVLRRLRTDRPLRALVTGDRGFLGRHFSEALEQYGYEVTGLDIKRSLREDCRRFFAEQSLTRRTHFDLVVHCAAVIGGRATIDGDPLATAINLELDAALFRWAARSRPGRVLYISSSAAYPVENQTPSARRLRIHASDEHGYRLHEDDLRAGQPAERNPASRPIYAPDQVYGWTKVIGEVLAGKLRDTGVPVTVVRPFSGYGADQDETYPFRAFVERARRREDPFDVWGDGEQVRDFIHVDDVVAGALAAAHAGAPGPVNLCTGRATSFNELAAMVTRAAGYAPEIRHLQSAPRGVDYRVGDPRRMRLCYRPGIRLEDGVRRALKGDEA